MIPIQKYLMLVVEIGLFCHIDRASPQLSCLLSHWWHSKRIIRCPWPQHSSVPSISRHSITHCSNIMERTRIFKTRCSSSMTSVACCRTTMSTHDKNMDLSIDFTNMKESDPKALRNRALVAKASTLTSRASLLW